MPGPLLTATVSETLKRGVVAGPLIIVGHALLELGLVLALVAGLGKWLLQGPVMGGLGLVGGAILLLMGVWMALTSRRAAEEAVGARASREPALGGPILAGVLTSVANPYWTIWWATVGLSYAAVSLQRGATGLSCFYAGHIAADFAWYGLVAAAVASGRKIFPQVVYRAVLVGCGFVLIGLGVWFLRFGLDRIG